MKKRLAYRLINWDVITESELSAFKSGQKIPFVGEVKLFKLSTGDFQFSSPGEFKTILSGPDYLLIKSSIANLLSKHAPDHIKSRPIRIFRKASGEEWLDYHELEIKDEIEHANYSTTDCPGISVFHMMKTEIFISPELKAIIEPILGEETGIKAVQEAPFLAG